MTHLTSLARTVLSCAQDLYTYLNTPAVQTALHVKATNWDVCR